MNAVNRDKTPAALLVGKNAPETSHPALDEIETTIKNKTFSLTCFSFDSYDKEQYLTCEAARVEGQKLSERLLREQTSLKTLLNASRPQFGEVKVMCFDEKGEFDHAVCTLRLTSGKTASFLSQTYFYQAKKLTAVTAQKGHLLPKGDC